MTIISPFTGPLFSLQSPSRARDKNKWSSSRLIFFPRINGPIDRQRKGVGVREEENIFLSHAPRSPMFLKRTKRKIKERLCAGELL